MGQFNTIPPNPFPPSSENAGTGGGGSYVLPVASANTLGGVKVGARLSIDDGVLSAVGQVADYSTAEHATGEKWIDGKTIYRKVVDCGALPNNNVKTVDSGLTNVNVYKIEGAAIRDSDKTVFPIPYVVSDNVQYQVSVSFNNASGIITLSTGSDRSAFTNTYIILYYTKESEV